MVSLFTPHNEEAFYSDILINMNNKDSGPFFSDTASIVNDNYTISSYSSSTPTDNIIMNPSSTDATAPSVSTASPGWSVVKSHTTSSELTMTPPPAMFPYSHPDPLHYTTTVYPKITAESSYYSMADYDVARNSTPREIWSHPSPFKEFEVPEFRSVNDTSSKKIDSPYMPFYQLQTPPPPPPPGLPQTPKERYHPRYKSANARLSCHPESFHQPLQFLSPPLAPNSLPDDRKNKKAKQEASIVADKHLHPLLPFQFHVALHASTAVVKKEGELPVTYLNRGQAYLIELDAVHQTYPGTMTSTFSISFHEATHRKVAKNYWKFWISQQEIPNEARAIELDANQTTGVYNVRFPSFDKVSFDWHGRFGAKIYIRFNCLSTDFSRIKGVKGIPMRASMETQVSYLDLPLDFHHYVGTFQKRVSPNSGQIEHLYSERCYCQIKLFRDKGAERKNKDDSKQMAKQLEKAMASTNGNPQHHPLWPILSQPVKPISYFTEIDTDSEFETDDGATVFNLPPIPSNWVPSSNKSSRIGRKRKQKTEAITDVKEEETDVMPTIKKQRPSSVHFFAWTQKDSNFPHQVELENLTAHELKTKLSALLTLHPARVSDILWRKKKHSKETDTCDKYHGSNSPGRRDTKKQNEVLVLVEDSFVAENISDGSNIVVEWEIKSDGNVNLILNF